MEPTASDYERLLEQYGALLSDAELSLSDVSDVITADNVHQLTHVLHDTPVRHLFTYWFV